MAEEINKKILVVEDDEDFLSILKLKFVSEGLSIITAINGDEGISMAESEKPDLIISDVLMPKMDGIEMIKKIRTFDKNVIVIFLTNIKDEDYTKNMKELGETEYLIKADLRINEIVNKVKEKLNLK
jgi:DNA-binding response OmpR family regulator